jgi:hypothetical protein
MFPLLEVSRVWAAGCRSLEQLLVADVNRQPALAIVNGSRLEQMRVRARKRLSELGAT